MTNTATSNIPVFLLKTKSTPLDGYDLYFSASGRYDPIFVPVLEHRFHDANLRDLRDLFISGAMVREYGGLIFTSQRAVEGFSRVVQEIGISASTNVSSSLLLYTVGPATYRCLDALRNSHLPRARIIGQEAGTGEILAQRILQHYNALCCKGNQPLPDGRNDAIRYDVAENQVKGESKKSLPLLFLVGEQHRDIIPKTLMSPSLPPDRRIQVDELIVYETVVMPSFESSLASAVRDRGCNLALTVEDQPQDGGCVEDGEARGDEVGEISQAIWIVVFSPAGCEAVLHMLDLLPTPGERGRKEVEYEQRSTIPVNARKQRRHRQCYIATIGPTTKEHLRSKFSFEPDACAETPSPEGLGSAIERFMAERGVAKG